MDASDIPVVVHIMRVSDGVTKRHTDTLWAEAGEPSTFVWEEGNYSCDCNRDLFFRRAAGEDPDLEDVTCSEGRFLVRVIGDDGAVLYDEWPAETPSLPQPPEPR